MEVYAFEMETKINSLEEELSAVYREKENAMSTNDALASELENLSEKLSTSNLELEALQEELWALVSLSLFLFHTNPSLFLLSFPLIKMASVFIM